MAENKELKMVECAVNAILDKKGYNVKSLNVGNIIDHRLFCSATGSNVSQLDAIQDSA